MKKLLLILSFISVSLVSGAQIAEAWVTMPDSICPYLTQQQRYYLLQQAATGTHDTITNVMEGKTVMDSVNIAANYCTLHVTENLQWTLYLTTEVDPHTATRTKCICLESTICAPICSTTKRYYDFAWNFLLSKHEPFVIEQTEEEKMQLL